MEKENTQYPKIAFLLKEMRPYTISLKEKNIFAVGARGHYENPITDLLAFFADTEEKHGLGSLIAEVFLSAFDHKVPISTVKAEREVVTDEGLRIDLLLVSEAWVLVVENKIFHALGNDLSNYKRHAEKRYVDKEILCLVLAPERKIVEEPWRSLTYKELIENLEKKFDKGQLIGEIYTPDKKWSVFFQDFISHLKDIAMEDCKENKARDEFVQKNFMSLRQATDLRNSFIDDLSRRLRIDIAAAMNQSRVLTKRANWDSGPALHYSLEHWHELSAVTVFLSEKEGLIEIDPRIRVYAYTSKDEKTQEKAEDFFGANKKGRFAEKKGSWVEVNGTLMVWETLFPEYDYEKIKNNLLSKMHKLNDFEKVAARENRNGQAENRKE
ncbi:MAG: PD-(D/E)XK nuclease family protein [Proteobacteria bacterium]|nr:PD-(D/E)XK nuclease family protein [Pseudomonadota bacterium]MCL2307305.1 PD-(D/E)XK nuclease family protein [Pseudomonadota bacterium]